MSRSAKRDEHLTRQASASGTLKDERSFVGTVGKWMHGVAPGQPHFFLKGVDMSRQREAVISRDEGCCTKCGRMVPVDAEADHIIPRGKGGCDCLQNLRLRCAVCHRGSEGRHS